MWTWLKSFVLALLFDEAAAQRYLSAFLFFFGSVLAHGGAIPGSGYVIPGLAPWSAFGEPVSMLALYLGAGGGLPKRRNGNGNGTARAAP